MSIVDDNQSTMAVGNFDELADRGDVAAHGVDAFGEYERPVGRNAIEGCVDGVEVGVGDDDGARSRQAAPVDQAGMVLSIGNDGDVRVGEQLYGRDVGLVAAGHEHGLRVSQPCGDLTFSLVVSYGSARREPRATRTIPEPSGSVDHGLLNFRLGRQAEVVR